MQRARGRLPRGPPREQARPVGRLVPHDVRESWLQFSLHAARDGLQSSLSEARAALGIGHMDEGPEASTGSGAGPRPHAGPWRAWGHSLGLPPTPVLPLSCRPRPLGGHNLEGSSGGSGSPSPGGNTCDSRGRQTWGDDRHSHCSRPTATLTAALTGGLPHVPRDAVSVPRQPCSLTPPGSPLHTVLRRPLEHTEA